VDDGSIDGSAAIARAFGDPVRVVRRGVFERTGMLDETWLHGDYMEWFTRVSDAGLVVEVLLTYSCSAGCTAIPSRTDCQTESHT